MIKTKLKICTRCLLKRAIWKNIKGKGYCQPCTLKLYPPKPIRYRSLTSEEHGKLYSKQARIFKEGKCCEAKITPDCTGCTKKYLQIHHKKGRIGKLLLDERFWMVVCSKCHMWITINSTQAIELGFSLSRLAA